MSDKKDKGWRQVTDEELQAWSIPDFPDVLETVPKIALRPMREGGHADIPITYCFDMMMPVGVFRISKQVARLVAAGVLEIKLSIEIDAKGNKDLCAIGLCPAEPEGDNGESSA